MKTELCSFCLKSGMLCQKCSAKVKSGEISELDLKIARLLLTLEKKYPSLQNIYFHGAVEASRTLAIVVGHGDVPRLLGYGGKIVRSLSGETGKSIRILEYGADDRKFLEDLFMPLSILTDLTKVRYLLAASVSLSSSISRPAPAVINFGKLCI